MRDIDAGRKNPEAAVAAASGFRRIPTAMTDAVTGRRISLLDWKAANVRATWILVAVVVALVAAIGWALGRAFDPASAGFYMLGAGAVGLGQGVMAYRFSDAIALRAADARLADRSEHRYLVNTTEAVAIGAGLPAPRVYVIDAEAPNAFATGRDPEHSAIAVTTGLLDTLDREELEGVIAHEMAHIQNFDIRLASMLAATVGVVVILRDLVLRWMRWGGRRRSGGGGGGTGSARGQAIAFAALVVLLILAPILATLLRLAISRRREFLADATGAYITRNPGGLADALEAIRDWRGEPLDVSEGVRHMFFTNPVARLNARGAMATHPPIDERIDRLRRM